MNNPEHRVWSWAKTVAGGKLGLGLGDAIGTINYILRVSEEENTTEKIYVGTNPESFWSIKKLNDCLNVLDSRGSIEIISEYSSDYDFHYMGGNEVGSIRLPQLQAAKDDSRKTKPEQWTGAWSIRAFSSDYYPTKNVWKPNSNKIISHQLRGSNGGGGCKRCSWEEKAWFKKVFEKKGYELYEIGGSETLEELVDVLSKSEFYVGVDTGPTHLALCVGTPIQFIRNCRSLVTVLHSYRHKVEKMNLYKNMHHFLKAYDKDEDFPDWRVGSYPEDYSNSAVLSELRVISPTDILSAGDLIDRIFILRLKLENAKENENDFDKVLCELHPLYREWYNLPHGLIGAEKREELLSSMEQLTNILKRGWDLETEIRKKICSDDLLSDPKVMKSYIESSICVHQNNDQRSKVKNKISSIFNSLHEEVKIY
jgi:hypothetical protein